MAAGARGERFIEYEGKELPVLFTNRALAEAEQRTGKIILQLANRLDLGMGDVATMLCVGLEAARRDMAPGLRQRKQYTLDDAWKIMDAVGYTACITAVMEAMMAVMAYEPEATGDEDDPPVEE